MLTTEDKKDIATIVKEALEIAFGDFAMSVQRQFEVQDSKFQELKNEMSGMATRQDLLNLREEFSIRYENRLDRHGDDIRLIKTTLKLV